MSPGHSRWTTSPGLTGRGHWACVRFLQVKRDARAERLGPQRSKTRILQVPKRRLPRNFPVVAAALNKPLGEQMCPEKGVSNLQPRRGAVSMKGQGAACVSGPGDMWLPEEGRGQPGSRPPPSEGTRRPPAPRRTRPRRGRRWEARPSPSREPRAPAGARRGARATGCQRFSRRARRWGREHGGLGAVGHTPQGWGGKRTPYPLLRPPHRGSSFFPQARKSTRGRRRPFLDYSQGPGSQLPALM